MKPVRNERPTRARSMAETRAVQPGSSAIATMPITSNAANHSSHSSGHGSHA